LNAVTVSEHGPSESGWNGRLALPAASVSAERYSWRGIHAVTRAPASGAPAVETATVNPPSPAVIEAGATTVSSRGRAVKMRSSGSPSSSSSSWLNRLKMSAVELLTNGSFCRACASPTAVTLSW
jgi:hypothetical protein